MNYNQIIKCFSFYDEYYSEEEIKKAYDEAVCIHFINLFCDEPWKNSTNPQYEDFKYYMGLTTFTDDEVFIDSRLPIWKRMIHKLLKVLPVGLFLPFAKLYVEKFGKF